MACCYLAHIAQIKSYTIGEFTFYDLVRLCNQNEVGIWDGLFCCLHTYVQKQKKCQKSVLFNCV